MFRMFVTFSILLALTPLFPAFAEQAKIMQIMLGESIELDKNSDGMVFEFYEVSIKYDIIKRHENGDEWIETVSLTIQREDEEPFKILSDSSFDAQASIGIFNFEKDGLPVLMFQTYSGGAHCCVAVTMVNLGADELEADEFGMFDGYFLNPIDIDGDGIVEIETSDNRFLYTFDSYASSYPPPLIFSAKNGKFYDASYEPRSDFLFKQAYKNMLPICLDSEYGISPGICAGVLAVAARLGHYKKSRKLVASAIKIKGEPESLWGEYSFCIDDECNKEIKFDRLLPAIDYALNEWGYLNNQTDLNNAKSKGKNNNLWK